jgi:hypothetical protein
VAEDQLDVKKAGQLEVRCEAGRARHLLSTFEPALTLSDDAHLPIMA